MYTVYLDNAATSHPKPRAVYKEAIHALKEYSGNPGRSSHRLAVAAAEEIYKCREAISGFLTYSNPENCIFTLNATYALNLAIKTTISSGHVIISDIEHNAVLRPIYKLARERGISFSVFNSDGDIESNVERLIRDDTKAIICTVASNVTGKRIPLPTLSCICKNHSLKLIIDASQAIGHEKIDLTETPCSILCAPAHKALFGMGGLGFAVICDGEARESFIEGGSGIDSQNPLMPELLPEHFEAGTLPTAAIASLRCGIDYINKVGIDNIKTKLEFLASELTERLFAIGDIKTYSFGSGIVSFDMKGIPSSVVSNELDRYSICVRSGLHCAPLIHEKLGTNKFGLTRVSFSYFNTIKETDKLYRALCEIKNKY